MDQQPGRSDRSSATVYDCGDIDPWSSHRPSGGGSPNNWVFGAGFLTLILAFLGFAGLTQRVGLDPWNPLCLAFVAVMAAGGVAMMVGVTKRILQAVRSLGPNF